MRVRDEATAARLADRFATWQQLFLNEGAARAYPYAWRLPDLARPLGTPHISQAQLALAHTLYCLGRFAEAKAAIPVEAHLAEAPTLISAADLAARCKLLLSGQADGTEAGYLAFLADRPLGLERDAAPAPDVITSLCDSVLDHWQTARRDRRLDAAAAQAALSRLRPLAPAMAAHAEAILAEAAFHVDPAWSLVWLDVALDQCARYAQHHLEARLLHLKSRALEANGQLRDAQRFLDAAQALAQRQGARLYLQTMRG